VIGSSGINLDKSPFKYSCKYNQSQIKWGFMMKSRCGQKVDIIQGYPGSLYLRKFFPKIQKLDSKFLKYSLMDSDIFRNDDILLFK